jgi:hypothetical protein
MAIMDPDTQATMDIGITDRGISGQTWHFVEFAMMDKTDDLSA